MLCVDPNIECVYPAGQSISLQPVGAKQLVEDGEMAQEVKIFGGVEIV